MAGVGGGDDAVDPELAIRIHRDLGAGGHVAREGLADREPAVHALGGGGAPARPLRCRVQHRQGERVVGHQRAAELERVLAGGMGQLVHEAFHVDGVLVDVDPAPEPRRHRRVAHGVVDEQVRDAVADGVIAVGEQALEGDRVRAVLECGRAHRGEDGLPGDAHAQPHQVPVLVERPRQLGLGDGVIGPVEHVLLAGPQQLDGRSRHLSGDGDRLPDIVVEGPASSEAPAQMDLVDLALGDRQSGRLGGRLQGRLAVLGRTPDLAALRGPARGGVHGLHGRVVLVGVAVDGLDRPGGARQRGVDVARPVADEGLLGLQSLGEHLGDRRAGETGVGALVPGHRQGVQRRLGVPPGVGDHGHRVVLDRHHGPHAGHAAHRVGLEAGERAAEDRAGPDRGVEHAGQAQIGPEDLLAGELVLSVQPFHRLASDRPVLRVLERHGHGRHQRGRGRRHLAVGGGAPAGTVGDDAGGGAAFLGRDAPCLGGGLDQEHPGEGAALAHVLLAAADTLAPAGGEAAPDLAAGEALSRASDTRS